MVLCSGEACHISSIIPAFWIKFSWDSKLSCSLYSDRINFMNDQFQDLESEVSFLGLQWKRVKFNNKRCPQLSRTHGALLYTCKIVPKHVHSPDALLVLWTCTQSLFCALKKPVEHLGALLHTNSQLSLCIFTSWSVQPVCLEGVCTLKLQVPTVDLNIILI